ncbi:MAG: YncE family protein [Dissulfurispiraceae bacterium]
MPFDQGINQEGGCDSDSRVRSFWNSSRCRRFKIYVTNYWGGTVSVIQKTTSKKTAFYKVTPAAAAGIGPYEVAVHLSGSNIYVSNYGDTNGLASNVVTKTVSVRPRPCEVAIDPSGHLIYVANYNIDTVLIINGQTSVVAQTLVLSSGPHRIAADTDGTMVCTANRNSDTVSLINIGTETFTDILIVGSDPVSLGTSSSQIHGPTGSIMLISPPAELPAPTLSSLQ